MFTGIIETIGAVTNIATEGSNRIFWIKSTISSALAIDQSVCHNGVCLTVDALKDGHHRVTAIDETLQKTNLGDWQEGTIINIERCLLMNGRLDGHIVQGHVDGMAECISVSKKEGSWEFSFSVDSKFSHLIIEKGSITLNGISLTIFNVCQQEFTVAIIPYTFEHTNVQSIKRGTNVNIEFDIVGKYLTRFKQLNY